MPYNFNTERDSSVDEILSSIKEIIEENTAKHYANPVPVLNNTAKLNFSAQSIEKSAVSVDEAMSVLAKQIGVPLSKDVAAKEALAVSNEDIAQHNPVIGDKDLINSLFDQAIEDIKSQLKVIIAKWVQENLPRLIKDLLHEEIAHSLKNMK
ncbi:DUF2497 domain-containing protein [Bartonella sp. TP]|uniref:DUF2497 domain-containing protein n=1 Tax=Bartonella sp. TP TaxID=3057550 RepID=UPI0025B22E85|nr:DUF2497 domain-containing protein [Bartonella sp. TP]MDN5249452.1 DUF2497 domain-containing protein [Alphaproteobacteria bacterium]WJW79799.1 DUF2497 domain-containing protein [Bartonella sp. TP]